MKYTTRGQYLRAILELHERAKRSGWNLDTAPRTHIAQWLGITIGTMADRNREYGISIDDIRTGNLFGTARDDG